jgi:hypothetical protein
MTCKIILKRVTITIWVATICDRKVRNATAIRATSTAFDLKILRNLYWETNIEKTETNIEKTQALKGVYKEQHSSSYKSVL